MIYGREEEYVSNAGLGGKTAPVQGISGSSQPARTRQPRIIPVDGKIRVEEEGIV